MNNRAMMMVVVFALLALATGTGGPVLAGDKARLKPFVVPTLDAPGELVDLRRVFDGPRGKDLPAVTVENGHFVAAGNRIRFWGVNLSRGSCFVPHDLADKAATRLAGFGVNCVRLFFIDRDAYPNGIWDKDFKKLSTEALERLDYLIAAFKREGIYVDINLHCARDFSKTGGSMDAEALPASGKLVSLIDPELIALQKKYARDLLTHRNAYTGLTYAEDPVVAKVDITNENSMRMGWRRSALAPRFEQRLVGLWNEFLGRRYKSDEELRRAWSGGLEPDESLGKKNIRPVRSNAVDNPARARDFVVFLMEADIDFFTAMRRYLKEELGVKASVTGTWVHGLWPAAAQAHMDVIDAHAYWDHPVFPRRAWDKRDWTIKNKAMVDDPRMSTFAALTAGRIRRADSKSPMRPMTVTEYNHPAPSDYQAEAIPMIASFAAAQDWDAVLLYNYYISPDGRTDQPVSFFNIAPNGIKMVQMAAGALLFRRGDIPTIPVELVTTLDPGRIAELSVRHGYMGRTILEQPELGAPMAWRFFARYGITLNGKHTVGDSLTRLIQEGGDFVLPELGGKDDLPGGAAGDWSSAGGALHWTRNGPGSGLYTAAGERSVALVGFVGEERLGQSRKLGPVRVTVHSPRFAAITVSSLDGRAIRESERLLITAAARQENTGQKWNDERTSVGDKWGSQPTLIEPVRATIRLDRAGATGMRLLTLDGRGRVARESAVMAKRNSLTFTLPGQPATLWYVLVSE